jgi:hypothetical protein
MVLSTVRLNELIVAGMNKARLLSPATYNTMNLQYKTGIRLSEVDVSRWELLGNGNYYLNTKKYNHPREFKGDEVPEIWKRAIENGDVSSYITNHSTYERRLRLVFGKYKFVVGKKRLVSHLFRHNWAKRKKEELGTNEAVREVLGEKRLSSAISYIASDIIYTEY